MGFNGTRFINFPLLRFVVFWILENFWWDFCPEQEQITIKKVLDNSMRPALRKALQSQLQEYDAIESDAHALASQRGWELREIQPGRQLITGMKVQMKLRRGNSDSKIAGMMIQGNTRGMITEMKNIHQFHSADLQVRTLSQKLIDCENANIRQMQSFL